MSVGRGFALQRLGAVLFVVFVYAVGSVVEASLAKQYRGHNDAVDADDAMLTDFLSDVANVSDGAVNNNRVYRKRNKMAGFKVRTKKPDKRKSGISGHRFPPASDEKRLTKYLLDNYKRIGEGGRPVVNSSLPVSVIFGLSMIQMDLDERDNTLTISVWCRYRWVDEYLTWDPSDFGGVKSVRLSPNRVWIPDIMLYNTADTHNLEREVLVVVSHNGSVLWIPHRIYRSSCSVDVTNFPFDSQTCHMTFGSWAYHGNEIDIFFFEDLERMDVSDLQKENMEWEITDKREDRQIQFYDCCADPYVTLIFTLELKRKLVFSSFILTLPCVFLAFMTLVVFWLPPERPDRTSLAMNLFASFLLLLLILVEAAPPTASSVPKLGVYYCFNMVLIMLSIFLSSFIINVSRRGETMHPVPKWLKALSLNGLAKVFCCTKYTVRPNRSPRRKQYGAEPKDINRPRSAVFINQDVVGETFNDVNNGVGPTEPYINLRQALGGNRTSANSSAPEVKIVHSYFSLLEKQLRNMEAILYDISGSLKERDISRELRDLRLEWQLVAIIVDRVFFFIFCVAIVLSLFFLFPRPY